MMRTTPRTILTAGLLSASALTGPAFAQGPAPAAPTTPVPAAAVAPKPAPAPRTAVSPRPAPAPAPAPNPSPRPSALNSDATPASYWGPAAPAPPKRKPTAVGRLFNRIGAFLGADEEMGTTPTFRDPSTGRTNTGASKPYMKRLEN